MGVINRFAVYCYCVSFLILVGFVEAQVANGPTCKSGEIVPGKFIIKHHQDPGIHAISLRNWSNIKSERIRKWNLSKIHEFTDIDTNLELVSTETKDKSGILPALLENAIRDGQLEYAIPDKTVCAFQAAGTKVSGRIRVLGASIPPYPRTLVLGGTNTLVSLPPNGSVGGVSLGFNGPKSGHSDRPEKFWLWDPDGDGLGNLLANIYTRGAVYDPYIPFSYHDFSTFGSDRLGHFGGEVETPFGSEIERFYGAARGNFDNDGKPDFLVSFEKSLYLLNNGQATHLADAPDYIRGIADFNLDENLDVLTHQDIGGYVNGTYVGKARYKIYNNDRTGNFTLASTFDSQERSSVQDDTIYTPDLNGDGYPDIVTLFQQRYSSADTIGGEFVIHFNAKNGPINPFFALVRRMDGARSPINFIRFGDVTGDGLKDIVLSNWYDSEDCDKSELTVIRNSFPDFVYALQTNVGTCVESLEVSDYDGDGLSEIALGTKDQNFYLLLNTTEGPSSRLRFQVNNMAQGLMPTGILMTDPLAVGDVLVTLKNASGIEYKTYSDFDGNFSFSNIPSDTYTISATRSGYNLISEVGNSITITQERKDINFNAMVLPPPNPDGYVTPPSAPADPGFGNLWGLHNTGQFQGAIPGYDIKAIDAWKITQGNPNLIVAILDEGIDYNHPDLIPNMWMNSGEIPLDGIDNDANGVVDDIYGINAEGDTGNPIDLGGHGTHVAGTIGAKGSNSVGVTGVSQEVKLMAVKVLGPSGGSDASVLKGLQYIIKMKDRGVNIRVINASLGGAGICHQAYIEALQVLDQKGILFVAAAGNGGDDGIGDDNDMTPMTPANCDVPNVISVANLSVDANLALSSNFGPTTVDLGAPGSGVLSTFPNGFYRFLSGTSMAAPHVSGIAALVLGVEPGLTPTVLRKRLMDTVTPLSHLTGKLAAPGIVNAFRAVTIGLPPPNGNGFIGKPPVIKKTKLVAKLKKGKSLKLNIKLLSATITDPDGKITSASLLLPSSNTAQGVVQSLSLKGKGVYRGTLNTRVTKKIKSVRVGIEARDDSGNIVIAARKVKVTSK